MRSAVHTLLVLPLLFILACGGSADSANAEDSSELSDEQIENIREAFREVWTGPTPACQGPKGESRQVKSIDLVFGDSYTSYGERKIPFTVYITEKCNRESESSWEEIEWQYSVVRHPRKGWYVEDLSGEDVVIEG